MNHQNIQSEAARLKEMLSSGKVEIPSFWGCIWPGVGIQFWLMLCPMLAFYVFNGDRSDTVMAVAGGMFIGFLVLIGVLNWRSVYLAIPQEFRDTSSFLGLMRRKTKAYVITYMFLVALCAIFGANTNGEGLTYVGPLLIVTVFMFIVGLADFGRYKASAVVSALQMIKDKKKGA
ncbi:hypothetical protein QO199_23300 [Serratia bockelmannii]|uniref:Conjugal transfer protein TraS n=2 Tax=Serratia bockelmannii TaxID=2703793 RepID=A0ABT8LW90_9GAMM|nr:hypothetical protein [Serratia bockelmannii]